MKWILWLPFLVFVHPGKYEPWGAVTIGLNKPLGTLVRERHVLELVYEHLESRTHSRSHGDAAKNLGSARCLIGERQEGKHYAQKPSPLWGLTERSLHTVQTLRGLFLTTLGVLSQYGIKLQCMFSSHFSLEAWEIMNLRSDSAAH